MIALLILAAVAHAQASYTISGVVINDVSGRPISKARLFLTSVQQRARVRSLVTEDEGRFSFDQLPAGKYDAALDWLRAKAQDYLPDDPDALPPLQESLL